LKSASSKKLEICIDGSASARAAAEGGADRVELCANLPEGGTTPSAGMIRAVRGLFKGELMVLIRPRGYDFLYSEEEMQVMLHDIRVARELGADGVVIGCLTPEGRIDLGKCERLLAAAGPLDVTFHRAFDMSRNLNEALEEIIGLGIKRVLTSGGQAEVIAGSSAIKELTRLAGARASIMPGGGVTEENLAQLLGDTRVHEVHLSARGPVRSGMTYRNERCGMGVYSAEHEYEWRSASVEKIRQAKRVLESSLNTTGSA
jgi:copper homeostasis protein